MLQQKLVWAYSSLCMCMCMCMCMCSSFSNHIFLPFSFGSSSKGPFTKFQKLRKKRQLPVSPDAIFSLKQATPIIHSLFVVHFTKMLIVLRVCACNMNA